MEDIRFVDTSLWVNSWRLIVSQFKSFDTWFGFCGRILLYALAWVFIPIIALAAVARYSFPMEKTMMIYVAVCIAVSLCIAYKLYSYYFTLVANSLDAAHGRSLRFFDVVLHPIRYLVAASLFGLIVCIGFALFIIPGFVFAIRFAFGLWAMVDQNCGIIEGLKISWEITRGRFLTLFIGGAILSLVFVIPLTYLFAVFFPFHLLVWSSWYVQLKQRAGM